MSYQEEIASLYKQAQELRIQGHPAESEILESKAAGILQEIRTRVERAPGDRSTATDLLYLAERDWAILGDHETVLGKIQRAIALREKQLGKEHPLTAEAIAKLAECHYLAGRFGEAETLYRRSVAIM